jgi:hypothetical protein
VAAVKEFARWMALAEVIFFYAMVQVVIWGGGRFRPGTLFLALALVALCIGSNLLHGDSRERVGLDPKHFWPCLRLVALVAVPVAIPLFLVGITKRFYWPWDLPFALAGYPVWGFAQEYALLGFVNNRLEDGMGGYENLLPWVNALLFSLAHLPNPILMTATFAAGMASTLIFRRHRHLVPIALGHALVGTGISLAFANINGSMSVGPGYLWRVGTPPGF